MDSVRQQKVSRQILRDLGAIFQQEGARILGASAMITVTKVVVTKDMQLARVFLSVFGSGDKETIINTVNAKASEIRFLLGKRVRHQLRNVPGLQFFIDDSLDYIENIDRLLNQ